jgi:hypothetical protein
MAIGNSAADVPSKPRKAVAPAVRKCRLPKVRTIASHPVPKPYRWVKDSKIESSANPSIANYGDKSSLAWGLAAFATSVEWIGPKSKRRSTKIPAETMLARATASTRPRAPRSKWIQNSHPKGDITKT